MPITINPDYLPANRDQALGYLVEEMGEALAAAGKIVRWGWDSSNPELPPEERETNQDWLARELVDVRRAVAILDGMIGPLPYPDGMSDQALRDVAREYLRCTPDGDPELAAKARQIIGDGE